MNSNCITGDSIITSFKKDVEAFFTSDPAFELRIEKVGGGLPTCKGVGDNARLCLPTDFFTQIIDDPKDFVFLLLVLGHEAAHYLNRHNEHIDKAYIESQGIEMWADFFGTKIAFVVLTFGAELSKFSFMPKNAMDRIDVFALALEKLSESYFQNSHPRYPEISTRIGTYVAGVMSFLEQYFKWWAIKYNNSKAYAEAQDPDVIVQRALSIQMRIYKNKKLKNWAMASEGKGLEETSFETISAIHRDIQGKQDALFKGMKPLPSVWLRLTYSIEESSRKIIVSNKLNRLEKTLRKLHKD